MPVKSRYAVGAGAAACAACCAAPFLALPVVAGLGASVVAFLCSGAFLAVIVAVVVTLLVWPRRRRQTSCAQAETPEAGPVDIELTTTPP